MWRHFILSLATVDTNNMVIVDREPLVWIDSDTEETGIGVNHESLVSFVQVVDDSSFGKVGHVGQIFQKFVFWRILAFKFGFLKSISKPLYNLGYLISRVGISYPTWFKALKVYKKLTLYSFSLPSDRITFLVPAFSPSPVITPLV